jgi:hypothetical protein
MAFAEAKGQRANRRIYSHPARDLKRGHSGRVEHAVLRSPESLFDSFPTIQLENGLEFRSKRASRRFSASIDLWRVIAALHALQDLVCCFSRPHRQISVLNNIVLSMYRILALAMHFVNGPVVPLSITSDSPGSTRFPGVSLSFAPP